MFSDDVLTVEWLCDRDKKAFCHDHVNPMHLEFYELKDEDWQKKYIEYVKMLFEGENTIEYVQMLFEGSLKVNPRIFFFGIFYS